MNGDKIKYTILDNAVKKIKQSLLTSFFKPIWVFKAAL